MVASYARGAARICVKGKRIGDTLHKREQSAPVSLIDEQTDVGRFLRISRALKDLSEDR